MLPNILLLPGSRKSELYRHLPILFQAMRRIAAVMPARWRIVLPNETLTYILVKCLLAELDGPKPHVAVASFSGAEGLGAVAARVDVGVRGRHTAVDDDAAVDL